jgi:hypothetical protein
VLGRAEGVRDTGRGGQFGPVPLPVVDAQAVRVESLGPGDGQDGGAVGAPRQQHDGSGCHGSSSGAGAVLTVAGRGDRIP